LKSRKKRYDFGDPAKDLRHQKMARAITVGQFRNVKAMEKEIGAW
jgi:hypothetical protein